jgi:hypothetical protein
MPSMDPDMRHCLTYWIATVISLAVGGVAPPVWSDAIAQSPARRDSLVAVHVDQAIASQRWLVTALDALGGVTAAARIMAGQSEFWASRATAGADHELGRYLQWQTAAITELVAGTVAPPIPPFFEIELSAAGQLARGRCVAIRDTQSCARQLAEVILLRLEAIFSELSNKRMQQTARLGSRGRSLSCEHCKVRRTIDIWQLGNGHAAADAQSR